MSDPHRHEVDLRRLLGEAPVAATVERRIVDGVLPQRSERRRQRVHRTLPRVVGFALFVAVLCSVVIWLTTSEHPPYDVARPLSRAEARATVGTEWLARKGQKLHHLGGHRMTLSQGAELLFADGTPDAPVLLLHSGTVDFQVEPLRGGRFVVKTKHARVTVLGTTFSVNVGERCTTVRVSHGRVRMDRVVAAAKRETAATKILRGGEEHAFCSRALERVNKLDKDSQRVLRAMRLVGWNRRLREAEALLEAYLAKKPKGSYAEEALFFLVLTKDKLGKALEAKKLATSFLERFPGSSRAERLRRWLEK